MTSAAGPLELAVRDEGRGEAVVLLHGLGGDRTLWNGVLPGLAEGHRVLAPDLRGHGRSPPPPDGDFGIGEMEADLLALLDARGAGPVHLVGLSAGGFVALQFALDHPERLRSLTVIGAASNTDNHTRAILDRWAETLRDEGFDAYLLRLLKDLFYPDWIESHLDFADRLRAQQRGVDPASVARWARALRSVDLRPRLGRLTLPTLVVHGLDDQVVDAAHARLLRQSIRTAELKLLPETGHLVPIERPEATREAIAGWVARAAGPGGRPGAGPA